MCIACLLAAVEEEAKVRFSCMRTGFRSHGSYSIGRSACIKAFVCVCMRRILWPEEEKENWGKRESSSELEARVVTYEVHERISFEVMCE